MLHSVVVVAGDVTVVASEGLAGLISFADPDGHAVEVFHGPEMGGAASTTGDSGFVAGAQGLGHLVLATSDMARAMEFYTSMLGMKVSDYVNGAIGSLGFLHCNPRHHSIAFVQLANPRKRINHFMLQRDSINDVGRTYDAVQEGVAPLLVTMGRHSNDEMVSFYMANPSGFGVEYGWGARAKWTTVPGRCSSTNRAVSGATSQ